MIAVRADEFVTGDTVKVRGLRGTWRFLHFGASKKGARWADVFGPIDDPRRKLRAFAPERLMLVSRSADRVRSEEENGTGAGTSSEHHGSGSAAPRVSSAATGAARGTSGRRPVSAADPTLGK